MRRGRMSALRTHSDMQSPSRASSGWRSRQLLLFVGSLAIVACIFLTPRVAIVRGSVLKADPDDPMLAAVIDLRTVSAYVIGIIAAIILLWLAIGDGARRADALS